MQGVLLLQVLLQGAVGVGPRAEVNELAPDLLDPHAGDVGEEREVGIGLGGLARRGRMDLGDGGSPDDSSVIGYNQSTATGGHFQAKKRP